MTRALRSFKGKGHATVRKLADWSSRFEEAFWMQVGGVGAPKMLDLFIQSPMVEWQNQDITHSQN
jgi:hypothetical protein